MLGQIKKLDGVVDDLHKINTKAKQLKSIGCVMFYLFQNMTKCLGYLSQFVNEINTRLNELGVKSVFGENIGHQFVFTQITKKSTNNYNINIKDKSLIYLLVSQKTDRI